MRTAGCAVKRSCSGERTKTLVLAMEPIGCVIETSLSAVGGARTYANSRDSALARPGRGRGARAPEVILVLGFGEPAGLACGLAGCSAPRSRAVALVPAVARIRTKKLQAALAFAAIPTSHRVPPARTHHWLSKRPQRHRRAGAEGTHVPLSPTLHRYAPASAGIGRFKPVLLGEIQTGADRS